MKDQLAELICQKLRSCRDELGFEFQESVAEVGVRYCIVDNLLPEEIARSIHQKFPAPASMRLMSSFREKKYTSKRFDKSDSLMSDITFAIQDTRVVSEVENITRIREQTPDPGLYAGGLSAMVKGHHLGPHIDNSHEASRSFYRTLNLLYYVTPDWKLESGGNLELWDRAVRNRVTIVSRFNRLVIMETTPTSWHSVTPVVSDETRCCVSNYYFSPRSPTGFGYFNVTSFSARPDQPIMRLLANVDNRFRRGLRILFPKGIGREDVYDGSRR